MALVYNSGWEKNWGFVPWTVNEMKHMAKQLKQMADPELVIFAEREGKPAGFALGLPNYNEILRGLDGRLFPFGFVKLLLDRSKIKGMRAAVFGLMPEFRHTGMSYLLYARARKTGHPAGATSGENCPGSLKTTTPSTGSPLPSGPVLTKDTGSTSAGSPRPPLYPPL